MLWNCKTDIYSINCKKNAECTHPKILVLISSKKAKVKSKCAECFTDRTIFDKINDEYDLEQLVKKFFFTDVFYKRTWRLVAWSAEIKTESLNSKVVD